MQYILFVFIKENYLVVLMIILFVNGIVKENVLEYYKSILIGFIVFVFMMVLFILDLMIKLL